MAARLRQRHQDEIKQKIQGSQLVNLLQDHALTGFYKGEELSATRIDAAKYLLNKIISNAPQEVDQTINGNMSISWPLPKHPLE